MPLPLSAPSSLSFIAIIYYGTTDGQFAEFQRGCPWPVTWEHGAVAFIFSQTDGKGRGGRPRSELQRFLTYVPFASLSAPLLPPKWCFSPLTHSQASPLPPTPPSSENKITNMVALMDASRVGSGWGI